MGLPLGLLLNPWTPDTRMPAPAAVLVFGRDHQLVHTRRLILQKAGFHVHTAASLADIQLLPPQPTIDVMLLCHSLSSQDCDDALLLTHERWPEIQTIALVAGSSDCGSNFTDTVMESHEGPAKLIDTVRQRIN
jgi:DNA-binding NtrC family response regulator